MPNTKLWIDAPSVQPLKLHALEPLRGLLWLRQAVQVAGRKPFGLLSLFGAFVVAALLLRFLGMLGAWLMLAALPLLSLGYMIATQGVLQGKVVHAGHLVAPLVEAHAGRRTQLIVLCVLYGVAMTVLMTLSQSVDQGSFERLMELWAQPRTAANRDAIEKIMASDSFNQGLMLRFGGIALASIPFWHAPGLIWWGGQSAMQSLFSSTLAVWRTKGAFSLYLLGFLALTLGAGTILGTLLSFLTLGRLVGPVVMTLGLVFTVIFYTSLWFSFDETFGVSTSPSDDIPLA